MSDGPCGTCTCVPHHCCTSKSRGGCSSVWRFSWPTCQDRAAVCHACGPAPVWECTVPSGGTGRFGIHGGSSRGSTDRGVKGVFDPPPEHLPTSSHTILMAVTYRLCHRFDPPDPDPADPRFEPGLPHRHRYRRPRGLRASHRAVPDASIIARSHPDCSCVAEHLHHHGQHGRIRRLRAYGRDQRSCCPRQPCAPAG